MDLVLAIRNNSGIAYNSEMPFPSGSTSALDKLYAVYWWKTKSNVLILFQGSKLIFFDNFPVGQVLSNVYLSKKISNLPEKKVL